VIQLPGPVNHLTEAQEITRLHIQPVSQLGRATSLVDFSVPRYRRARLSQKMEKGPAVETVRFNLIAIVDRASDDSISPVAVRSRTRVTTETSGWSTGNGI
jgi:hypothetical protein